MRAITTAMLVVALSCTAVVAQEGGYSSNVVAKCKPDAERLCSDHLLGSSAMKYCMEAKQRSISRDCLIALEDDGIIPRGSVKSAKR